MQLFRIDNDVHERFQDIFPAFKSLKLEAVINSRSLYLHVRRVMNALENAVFSLYDAEVFIEYLRNFGERHKTWPVRLEHFDVCILLCRSRLFTGTYCCIALYNNVNFRRGKYRAIYEYISLFMIHQFFFARARLV